MTVVGDKSDSICQNGSAERLYLPSGSVFILPCKAGFQVIASSISNIAVEKITRYYTAFILISMVLASCSRTGAKYFNEGVELIGKNEYQRAAETFSKGIEANDLAKGNNFYGRAYANYELKHYAQAKLDIEKSLKSVAFGKKKLMGEVYWLKGIIASKEGEKKLEIQSYKTALKHMSNNNQLKLTLGLALIEDGQLNEAILVLTEVINTNNKEAFAYNNRALGYIKMGELEKAKADLEASKSLDNQNPFLYKNYFHYYTAINEPENACKVLDEALSKDMLKYGDELDTNELMVLKVSFCK